MRLCSLHTAVPEAVFTPEDCWRLVGKARLDSALKPFSFRLIRRFLHSDTGVEQRHFALTEPESVFERSADQLAEAFRREAPRLAHAALEPALAKAGLEASQIDALFVCTCTGYLCPGVSSYLAELAGLRQDAVLQDSVGLGCGAAVPLLRSAQNFLAAHPGARVATVAVEICSAAFYLDDDPGVIISALLFSDGAAACIWSGEGPGWRCQDFHSLHRPEHRDRIRFETRNGKLRNLLHSSVPNLAADAVAELARRSGLLASEKVLSHSGGRDVLDAIEERLPGHRLDESREILRTHGNMSSPSVLFALRRYLDHRATRPKNGESLWMTAFGAGFSAHACRLVWNG